MNKIYFGGPSITKIEKKYVLESVTNGFYDGMKKDLINFEVELKKLLKISYAHLTFTCTHAMHLALLSCGVKKGDEVITPEISWVATAQAIAYTGATSVFVDVDPLTFCIDPQKIKIGTITNEIITTTDKDNKGSYIRKTNFIHYVKKAILVSVLNIRNTIRAYLS